MCIKRSPCKRYINLTGISNLMKERNAYVANYKCCKLPEMLPTQFVSPASLQPVPTLLYFNFSFEIFIF
jgi:hypothetical protein